MFVQYKLDTMLPFLDGVSINGGMYNVDHRPIDSHNRANLGGYITFDLGASYDTDTLFPYPTIFRVEGHNIANIRYWVGGDQDALSEGTPIDMEFSMKVHL